MVELLLKKVQGIVYYVISCVIFKGKSDMFVIEKTPRGEMSCPMSKILMWVKRKKEKW